MNTLRSFVTFASSSCLFFALACGHEAGSQDIPDDSGSTTGGSDSSSDAMEGTAGSETGSDSGSGDTDGEADSSGGKSGDDELGCDELLQRAQTAAQAYVEREGLVGLSVGIRSEGCEPLAVAWGEADTASQTALSPEHLLRAGSITKTFTAALVLKLAERDTLSLDDPLPTWGIEFEGAESISLRQLLNHTSGLPDYQHNPAFAETLRDDPDRAWTPRELVDLSLELERAAAPGERHVYANTNYVLAGLVVEAATGQSYAEALRELVLEPHDLAHTYVEGAEPWSDPMALGYLAPPEGEREATEGFYHASGVWSAGAIVTTPAELGRWLELLLEGDVLSESSRNDMLDLVPITYGGYGLGILGVRYNDFRAYGHNGAVTGFQAAVFHAPDLETTVAVMHNQLNVELDDEGAVEGIRTDPSTLAVHLIDIMAGGGD